jgi:hypothetical protein
MSSSRRLFGACRAPWQHISKAKPTFTYRGLSSRSLPKYNIPKPVVNRQNLNALAVLLAATMCGAVGGYSIAHSTGATSIQATQTPKYGTAEDFKLAAKELKEALPRDGAVSTDNADLVIHGGSPYHYHDGLFYFVTITLR